MSYLNCQRVIVEGEIGYVITKPGSSRENHHLYLETQLPNGVACTIDFNQWVANERQDKPGLWVYVPSRGYAACFNESNVQPLRDGQL